MIGLSSAFLATLVLFTTRRLVAAHSWLLWCMVLVTACWLLRFMIASSYV